MPDSSDHRDAPDLRPVPDPTLLTTQQLVREITSLRDFFDTRIAAIDQTNQLRHQILETRLGGMDRAISLVQAETDRIPSHMDEKLNAVKEIHEEKFASVQTQFKERDVRTDQSSKDSKVAVDAALQAAKEAVGEQNKSSALAISKSEAATAKQIDQISLLIQTSNRAVDDKFDDLKERLTRIEGKDEGSVKAVSGHQATSGLALAIIAAVTGVVIGIVSIVVAVVKH